MDKFTKTLKDRGVDVSSKTMTPEQKKILRDTIEEFSSQSDSEITYETPTEVRVNTLDSSKLLAHVKELRKNGHTEDDIKASVKSFLEEEKQINNNVLAPSMLKHEGSIPMPSQQEINEMYEHELNTNGMGYMYSYMIGQRIAPYVPGLRGKIFRKENILKRSFRYSAIQVIKFLIFLCKKVGIK